MQLGKLACFQADQDDGCKTPLNGTQQHQRVTSGAQNAKALPENESPRAGETVARAKQIKSQKKNTPVRSKVQDAERHSFALYCGQERIGKIEQRGRSIKAYAAPKRHLLGIFKSVKAAAAAIGDAHGCNHAH